MSENFMQDAIESVETAQSKGVFKIGDAIKKRAYPTTDVKVYIDEEAAYQLALVNARLTEIAQDEDKTEADNKEFAKLERKARSLAKDIEASALTFHLRGIAPGLVDAIRRKGVVKFGEFSTTEKTNDKDDEHYNWYAIESLAHHIVKVSNANGDSDEHNFTPDEVADLDYAFPADEMGKLYTAANQLTFSAAYFQGATDAGFLPKP